MEELNNSSVTAENTAGTETNNDETITMTQQELDLLLQKTGDKRVTEALKKAEKKNADKVREAQKLANMDASLKYEYELQQREAAIAAKEAELALMENKNEASKILADKGLDLSLVDFIVAEDADTMMSNIKLLDNAFKKSVKAEVEKRLASKVPTKSLPTDLSTVTKDKFNKMTVAELTALKNEQPEVWAELTK